LGREVISGLIDLFISLIQRVLEDWELFNEKCSTLSSLLFDPREDVK
jgi:hypothetical protein